MGIKIRMMGVGISLGLGVASSVYASECEESLPVGTLRREVAAARDAYFVVELEGALDRLIAVQERLVCMQEPASPADLRELYVTLGAVLLALQREDAARRAFERSNVLGDLPSEEQILGQEVRLVLLDVRESQRGRTPTSIKRMEGGGPTYLDGHPLEVNGLREGLTPAEHFIQYQVDGGWAGRWVDIGTNPLWWLEISRSGVVVRDPDEEKNSHPLWYVGAGMVGMGAALAGWYRWEYYQAEQLLVEAQTSAPAEWEQLQESYHQHQQRANLSRLGAVSLGATGILTFGAGFIWPGSSSPTSSHLTPTAGVNRQSFYLALGGTW